MTATAESTRVNTPRLGVARSRRVATAGGQVGQWWSPPWLARELAVWSGLGDTSHRWRVLDAGAGQGALSAAAAELGAEVIAVERDARLLPGLEAIEPAVSVRHADFLSHDPRQMPLGLGEGLVGFDVCLTNPPWEGDLPERFLLRGAELARRCCAIVPLNMLCGSRRRGVWDVLEPVRVKALAHRPRFLGARGGMRDVMLLEVRARAARVAGPHRLELEIG